MTHQERELRQQLTSKIEEAKKLAEGNQLEEAKRRSEEAKQLRERIDTLQELREMEYTSSSPGIMKPVQEPQESGKPGLDYRDLFLKTLRHKPLSYEERQVVEERSLQGGVPEDGGLLIPPDIQTLINELKREFVSLEGLVTVEAVSSRSGSRVLEKLADITPFTEITELGNIPDTDHPKFKTITYAIKDRAGILPISNTLLADTNQNLMSYLARWIAKKSTITRNKLILDLLNKLTKKPLKSLDDIKQLLNVDLDPSIALNATIVTNQDGYHFLDVQKDTLGHYLLQPDPTEPKQKRLFGCPVVVIGNRFLPTNAKKVPIIIGNLQEAIVLFDRQQYSMKSTDVGGDSFKRNSTDIRVIQREDVQLFDEQAAIFGELALVSA